jgi:hypothetical protein
LMRRDRSFAKIAQVRPLADAGMEQAQGFGASVIGHWSHSGNAACSIFSLYCAAIGDNQSSEGHWECYIEHWEAHGKHRT